jgi:A/G-specific adenine glycosylase
MNYKSVHKKLNDFFNSTKRELNFRRNRNPYKIWISEVMLQQTRVNSMLNHFDSFIEKFPNISSLSLSKENDILALWKGLGYYSRALNLQKGAIFLMENYGGEFPRTLEEIIKVPGIGPYTGSAILSLGYDLPYAVLDGNVKRVLARLFEFKKPINDPKSQKELQSLADSFLNLETPSIHNEAMMELGGSLCNTKYNCIPCPLNSICLGFQNNTVKEYPVSSIKNKKIEIEQHFLLLFDENNNILLYKDNKRRFFKKIYALPYTIYGKNLPDNYLQIHTSIHHLINSLDKKNLISAGNHSITNHSIKLYFSIHKIKSDNLLTENLDYKFTNFESLAKDFPSSISKKITNKLPNLL